jgi:hypothetical protein
MQHITHVKLAYITGVACQNSTIEFRGTTGTPGYLMQVCALHVKLAVHPVLFHIFADDVLPQQVPDVFMA